MDFGFAEQTTNIDNSALSVRLNADCDQYSTGNSNFSVSSVEEHVFDFAKWTVALSFELFIE